PRPRAPPSHPAQLLSTPLHDLRLRAAEVTEPDPARRHTKVRDARPGLALDTVRKAREVELLQALELGAARLVGRAFELHRATFLHVPADDERDARIAAQVLALA